MKVGITKQREQKEYGEVEFGGVFSARGNWYIRTKETSNSGNTNAVCLADGMPVRFMLDNIVTVHGNAKLKV